MTTAAQIEQLRRLASEQGVPLDCVDRLAVSTRVAAKLLSVSAGTIANLIDRGEMAYVTFGRSRRIEVVEILDYLSRNRRLRPAPSRRSTGNSVGRFIEGVP